MTKSKASGRQLARGNLASWHDFRMAMIDYRERSGLTQKDVAERLGITQSAVSQFESFGGNPRVMTIIAYAQALNVGIDFSLDGSA
jgi:transcriptional regulator with XRE-family HTH domain